MDRIGREYSALKGLNVKWNGSSKEMHNVKKSFTQFLFLRQASLCYEEGPPRSSFGLPLISLNSKRTGLKF